MTFSFSATSKGRLIGVAPRLVDVVYRALSLSPVDFLVVEGVRTDEQAYLNFGKGRTAAECAAASCPTRYARPAADKVTWLRDPLNTKHRRQTDGYGHAVDLLPAPYDWKDTRPFDVMAAAVLRAAELEGVHVRWGADWDEDGRPRERGESDSPHFELA